MVKKGPEVNKTTKNKKSPKSKKSSLNNTNVQIKKAEDDILEKNAIPLEDSNTVTSRS